MTTLLLTYASLLVAVATICIVYARGYRIGYREGRADERRSITPAVLQSRHARMIHGRN